MVYYFRVDEFVARANTLAMETVKVNGLVADGSIRKSGMNYNFLVQGAGKNQVQVSYSGVVPDTFREGSEVVVEGKYDSRTKVFHCSTLLAKCPSKYEERKQQAKKS
jgi:cytochrome c-type biogenesis protein CcmE